MKSSKNINSKLRLNKQNLFGFIPSMQQSVLVKKNNEKDNIKDIIKIEIYIKMKLKKWKNIFQIK